MSRQTVDWNKIFSREYGVQYCELTLRSLGFETKGLTGYVVKHMVYLPEQKNQAFYCSLKEWEAANKSYVRKYAINKARLNRFIRAYLNEGRKYIALAKRISGKKYDKLNKKEKIRLYNAYNKEVVVYSCYLWIAYAINVRISEKANKLIELKAIKNKKEKNIHYYIEAVNKPSALASVFLLNDRIRRAKNKKELIKLKKEFEWLSCLDIHNNPLSEKQFNEYVRKARKKKLVKIISLSKIKTELKLNKKDIELIEINKKLAYLKDLRDDFRKQGVYNIQPFFENIAKDIGMTLKEFSYARPLEVVLFLSKNKKPDINKIKQRMKNGFLSYIEYRKSWTIQGKEMHDFIRKNNIIKIIKTKKTKTLKGTCASKGAATGKAKIVKVLSDLSKIKKGNIMVAITTHPDYVPAMEKAAAIITDEGGLTSHAAIVSRELKKPCIVGTKTATKVLKDNDNIEVDAEKGIVTIIK